LKKILTLFRNRNKTAIAIAVIVIGAVVAAILLWPSGPKKPAEIPLGDYSYAIEYTDYRIDKLMQQYNLPSV
jgi:hypothetical protein